MRSRQTNITSQTWEAWRSGNSTEAQRLLGGVTASVERDTSIPMAALAPACLSSRLVPDSFAGRPLVSILLEYFKRPQVVASQVTNMRAGCAAAGVACELVVNVDNPHEAGAWAEQAADGFVVPVFSANVHEARGYNRVAKAARGKYLIIWQDDQVPPTDGQWLLDLIKLFDTRPQIGIIGMNCYRLCANKEGWNRAGSTRFWEPDPLTGFSWTYAQFVDFAPMAIRASLFRAVGGLEEGWTQPGECGIVGDWEFCMRAWLSGWQVAFLEVRGRSGDGQPGGTHTANSAEKCWGRAMHVSGSTNYIRHSNNNLLDEMCNVAWALNMLTFKHSGHEPCPYGQAPTNWGNCTAPDTATLEGIASRFRTLQRLHR